MSALYTLFIYPLELLFEVVFSIANRIVGHPGFAIIILSLAVNFLVLPLYKRADEVQKEERDLEASLARGIAHIKKTFKGDERMMMLNTYYAQNNYSPLYVLRGSVSLLLQIPFFMAAYRFLSNLKLLRGVSLGPIHDLGAPDQMIVLAGIGINVLPILMTLINFISGYIYTKGLPLKNKVQLYGMAIVFLVLLYNSPSGLAFYWTLNNVFSMLKNIYYRFKRPGFALACTAAGAGLLLVIYVNTLYDAPYAARQIKLTAAGLLLILPLVFMLITGKMKRKISFSDMFVYGKEDRNIFLLSGVFMTILTGILIPSAVVRSDPTAFMNILNLESPNKYIIHAALIAAGFFIVWGSVFFYLSEKPVRVLISRVWWALCPVSVATYLFFGTKNGTLSKSLVYDVPFTYTSFQLISNLVIVLVVLTSAVFLARKSKKITSGLAVILVLCGLVMGVRNMISIDKAYKDTEERIIIENMGMPSFSLSTEGRNVMVIMLDRAPGFLVPIVFDELPYLYDQFDGFTFYPNTISFGAHTKHATPALFGGYDYTPESICMDTDKTLRETQNEALSVMPVLFSNAGYEVNLFNPPFAGYASPPDLRVFAQDGYEGINSYLTQGLFQTDSLSFDGMKEGLLNRNFFCYAIFKVSPLIIQNNVYDNGNYNMADLVESDDIEYTIPQNRYSPSYAVGIDPEFIQNYNVLYNLDAITDIVNGNSNTFMYIDNETTHTPSLLSEPTYEPMQIVDNTEYDASHAYRFENSVCGFELQMDDSITMSHYTSNAAAYILLGRYFDFLRAQGVWDNTRIIVVADHGTVSADVAFFGDQTNIVRSGIQAFNPVLMVKDFDSVGFSISEDLMTNADVPYIASNGIINDPVNPFTGNRIIDLYDYDGELLVYDSNDWNVTESDADGDAVRFIIDNWYSFDGSQVFDIDAWHFVGVQ